MIKRANKKKSLVVPIVIIVSAVGAIAIIIAGIFGAFDLKVAECIQFFSAEQIDSYTQLTAEQRAEDIEAYFTVAEESMPYIKEMKTDYGFSLYDKKDEILNAAKNCKNDYEFLALTKAVSRLIPSGHSDTESIDYNKYTFTATLRTLNILSENTNVKNRVDAYRKYLVEAQKEYDAKEISVFRGKYIDGTYIVYSSPEESELNGIILAVDGKAPNDYIPSALLTGSNVKFDSVNGIPYRPIFIFADKGENPVDVKIQLFDGGTVTKTYYNDIANTFSYFYGYNYREYETESPTVNSVTEDDIPILTDDSKNLAYIKVDSFGYKYNSDVFNKICDVSSYENIIIDVRNNGGGYVNFWTDTLYTPFFKDNLEYCSNTFFTDSKYSYEKRFGWFGGELADKFCNISVLPTKDVPPQIANLGDYNYLCYTDKYEISGTADLEIPENRRIYLLVNDFTCSAADSFTAFFQQNNLATIVGTQTSGEGNIAGVCKYLLPNSLICLRYTPYMALNNSEKINNLYGTQPDYFVNNDLSYYYNATNYNKEGHSVVDLDFMSKYDKQFMKVLSLIEENK